VTINIVGLKTCGDCRIKFRVVDRLPPKRTQCEKCGQSFVFSEGDRNINCYIEDVLNDYTISRYPKRKS
jgi:hypothetical protein